MFIYKIIIQFNLTNNNNNNIYNSVLKNLVMSKELNYLFLLLVVHKFQLQDLKIF